MRRLNIFLVIGIFITFIAHSIMGGLELAGAYVMPMTWIARACEGLVTLHIVVTCILGYKTLRARRLSGAGYFKDNLIFWIRRISGITILIPLVMHFTTFGQSGGGAYRLREFTTGKLISQIFLVICIAFHGMTNIRPLMISLGVKNTKSFTTDILLILSVLLLLFGISFAIYYTRWIAF